MTGNSVMRVCVNPSSGGYHGKICNCSDPLNFTAFRGLNSYCRHTQIGLVWSSLDESFNWLF